MVRRTHVTWQKRRFVSALAALAPLLVAGMCGGEGGNGSGAVVGTGPGDCAALFGTFPPGLGVLPESGNAVVATGGPETVITFALGEVVPRNVSPSNPPPLPPDSDGDGEPDFQRSCDYGFGLQTPVFGRLTVAREDLVLVSASGYEQVLAFDPSTAALVDLDVTNPAPSGLHDPRDHLFLLPSEGRANDVPLRECSEIHPSPPLPPGDVVETRTALATRVCVRPPSHLDSRGDAFGPECDPSTPSFHTSFTAGTAVAGDLLLVATSNLRVSGEGRFYPGTVLLFSFDDTGARPALAPLVEQPVIHTTGFNPTSVTPYTTASGRALALVGNTGAIRLATGGASVETDASIDVIDVATRRIAATIPMGPAALGFAGLVIDDAAALGVAGSPTLKQVYAVDLSMLDDEGLYADTGSPIVLDGSDATFPDARIFTGEAPFALPRRRGGPAPDVCDGWTNVLIGPDLGGDEARREVYVTDGCDGTLSVIDVDLDDADEVPLDGNRFALERQVAIAAANVPENVGRSIEPDRMLLGPGGASPGVSGPTLYHLINRPHPALLCSVDLSF